MADITAVLTRLATRGDDNVRIVLWETMGNADTGVGVDGTGSTIQLPGFADRTVQVAGTFGGATVTVQGSNDGTNWATLRDPQGADLTFTVAGIKQVLEVTRHIRATTSGGAGTDVDVTLL